jgi:aminopeptidase-like protein
MNINRYYNLAKNILFPINRSITGNGIKKTLHIIKKEIPFLKIKKIQSGSKVFDWTIPDEWNITDAYVKDKYSKKIINFKNNNLHVLGYSSPVNKKISKEKLMERIYFLKNQPTAIPYVTSYYNRNWGFCISYNQKKNILRKYNKSDQFRVFINSNFNKKGFLNYGEIFLKGKSKKEILISTYICHPSMANNELSGPIVSMSLINYFKKKNNEYSLRFLFLPETIGSISYLSKNIDKLKKNVIGGYNLSCIGDERQHSCMFSKYENSLSDKSLVEAYKKLRIKFKRYSFLKRGSDERQYNSPGIDLPIASIFRTKYGEYPEYHTSLDNFDVVTLNGVKGGYEVAKLAIQNLMERQIPKVNILCEPQLGKRNLYSNLSFKGSKSSSRNITNFLQYSDGLNDLNGISKKIKIDLRKTKKIFQILKKENLVY